jgi:hypothetical protein
MNRRNIIKSLAMTVLASSTLLGSLATATTPEKPWKPGKGKGLSVGQTLRYDEGLKVTFLAVLKDSRCPINARCVSAGNAKVLLRVKAGNQKPKIVTLNTAGKQGTHIVIPANKFKDGEMGIPKSYGISVGTLTPQPEIGKKTRQSDYRLKLAISVAL